MPRVAFYCPQAAPLFEPSCPLGHGGAEIDIYYLSRWLAQRPEFEVHALIASWDGIGDAPITDHPDGVILHPFYRPGKPWNRFSVPRRMARRLTQIQPEIVLQGAAGAETGLLARWCGRNGKRFVYRVAHDIDCTGEYLRWQFLRGRLFRSGLRAADRVIALTQRQRTLLAQTFQIDAAVLPYAHPPVAAAPRPHADRRFVLWIGRFESWKRPEVVLELARALPELQFRLVGRLEGEVADAVRLAARELANVELPGPVPFAQTGALFEQALALVSTSQYEGYPHAFLQAQRAGTPVCSLEVDPDGALADGAYGCLARGKMEDMIAALSRLASDPPYFEETARSAQSHFSERHDLERVGPALVALLDDLLDPVA